jgi:prefoldin subunit 5
LGKKITKEDKAELRRRFKEEMEVNEAEMARLKEACKKGIMFNFSSSSYLAFVKRLKGEIVTELKKEFKVAPDKEEAFKRLYSKCTARRLEKCLCKGIVNWFILREEILNRLIKEAPASD